MKEISCVIYWIEIYPVDSIIYPLSNWGQRFYTLVYQLRCTSCTDWVITEEYSGGNHFIIIADRPPRRQTFSHLLLIRSKSTLLLEERILKLMIRALHDCACNTVLLKTVIYSTGSWSSSSLIPMQVNSFPISFSGSCPTLPPAQGTRRRGPWERVLWFLNRWLCTRTRSAG